jgi:hypothetical protein
VSEPPEFTAELVAEGWTPTFATLHLDPDGIGVMISPFHVCAVQPVGLGAKVVTNGAEFRVRESPTEVLAAFWDVLA